MARARRSAGEGEENQAGGVDPAQIFDRRRASPGATASRRAAAVARPSGWLGSVFGAWGARVRKCLPAGRRTRRWRRLLAQSFARAMEMVQGSGTESGQESSRLQVFPKRTRCWMTLSRCVSGFLDALERALYVFMRNTQSDGAAIRAKKLVGCSVLPNSMSSQSIFCGSSGMSALIAAWQAMEAAMQRRRSPPLPPSAARPFEHRERCISNSARVPGLQGPPAQL